MPMPTYEEAMLPVLRVLSDGQEHRRMDLGVRMADHFGLTEEERGLMLPSGTAPVIRSRTGWALSYMKQAGLIAAPRRGWYTITAAGRAVLAEKPAAIDSDYLMRFDSFREFLARTRVEAEVDKPAAASPSPPGIVEPEAPPDEALENAYSRLRASVESDVLEAVKAVTPRHFEEIVIDLLVKMGYGGSRAEAARAIGRTGDGGIDGVIDEDRLGLDVIYVQAKRWEGSVGRPEIQKFAGALQGQRASRGIFITTSKFTRDAEEYAGQIMSRIVLIDGRRLASLMFEFNVGVTPRSSFTVKSLDGDYFEEA